MHGFYILLMNLFMQYEDTDNSFNSFKTKMLEAYLSSNYLIFTEGRVGRALAMYRVGFIRAPIAIVGAAGAAARSYLALKT